MRRVAMSRVARAAATSSLLAVLPLLAACELKEVSLTEPLRVVVAEGYVRLNLGPAPGASLIPSISVFLHETLDTQGHTGSVPGARVAITRARDQLRIPLTETVLADCVSAAPVAQSGTCYTASPVLGGDAAMKPGDRLALRVELPGGGTLTSETSLPGGFDLLNVADGGTCTLDPLTSSDLVWSRSAGAWAYITDTFVQGIAAQFDPAKKLDDPMYLWGLSISAQDTAIVFPRELGLFSRGDMDHDVSVMLQKGLPAGASATVSIAAVDRNWVNWARGASFNPSGVVRVPSVLGDGTGVFASTVVHSFRIDTAPSAGAKKCPAAAR